MSEAKKGKGEEPEKDVSSSETSVSSAESGVVVGSLKAKSISGYSTLTSPSISSLISTPFSSLAGTPISSLMTSAISISSTPISSLGVSSIPSYVSGLGDYSKIGLWADQEFVSSVKSFEDEVAELRKQVESQALALSKQKSSAETKEGKIAELQKSFDELNAKLQLQFLLGRVHPAAQRELLNSETFREQFVQPDETPAVVLSVDIRRSTELMLKARTPQAFADFVTTLCSDMMRIITEQFGVFDKFTGDGVLAFFPEFYSGPDAVFYAVEAADKCHASFQQHYQQFRRSFTSVLTDTGLGIGLDYGPVHLVQIAGGITVVGAPVVYACRLGSAPPNVTLANQPAYEVLSDRCGSSCFIEERILEIKHEGSMLAYAVRRNGREYAPAQPAWLKDSSSGKKKTTKKKG
jgi:class 3 adenylate cyclase